MEERTEKIIWTIGHSTHPLEEFLAMLHSFSIELLADVRRYPGSRKYPQYNKDQLEISLPEHQIDYLQLENLGGRRKVDPESENTVWRNASFRGYADYMETDQFEKALEHLKDLAQNSRTAIMCSEAVWWRCHRSMVSDALKAEGWDVRHIMGVEKLQEHPFTQPAKIVNGELTYKETD